VLGSETLELPPPAAFHAAAVSVQRGRNGLAPPDAQRLRELTDQLLEQVPRRQRPALARYLETPQVAPERSADFFQALESALAALPEAERLRLQWLWEATILAAPTGG